ncbi:MAG: hypothetical protein ACTTJ7_04740 [Treponema sp.]
MVYSGLEKKLKLLSQTALEEISSYVDYILFKFTTLEKKCFIEERAKKRFRLLKRYSL